MPSEVSLVDWDASGTISVDEYATRCAFRAMSYLMGVPGPSCAVSLEGSSHDMSQELDCRFSVASLPRSCDVAI
eukprot:2098493-Amphidinium_carterae.2